MLIRLTKDLQCNINNVLDLKELVVGEMVADKNVSTCTSVSGKYSESTIIADVSTTTVLVMRTSGVFNSTAHYILS
jgi:hypothetical protein